MYHSIDGMGDITWSPGMSTAEQQQYASQEFAKSVAAQSGINAGRAPAVDSRGVIDPAQTSWIMNALPLAQAGALNTIAPAQAQLITSQATQLVPAQSAVLQSQVPINTETAKAQAADTYQQVQGGGIAAQAYTALPWVLGGALALSLIGWILYANKRKK